MMFSAHRSDDAVITICQDNNRQVVEIRELNPPAENALGYQKGIVAGKPLSGILPSRIQKLLAEYVEFEEGGNDVGSVLSKVQSFCVINSQGKEMAFRLKVLRSESLDKNDYFRLILQDRADRRKTEAFQAMLHENFRGHEVLDKHTDLPDRNSLAKDLELVEHYVGKEAVKACLAVLEIDNFAAIRDRHGKDTCYALLKHMAVIARQSLRTDDTIGCAGLASLGIILMDTTMESARIVLNRLRWLVAATPLPLEGDETLAVTASIAFADIGPHPSHAPEKGLLEGLETMLAAQAGQGNVMVEAGKE